MPRRFPAQTTLGPRRLRRGRTPTAISGDKLTITVNPPSTFQSGVAGSGCTVRLQTGSGQDIARSGVVVSVALPLGSAATLTPTPATATTDANGIATFTALLLTGVAGTYAFTFSATGYASAVANGIQLIAGPAVASTSSATVGNGRVGQETPVNITLRDAQGNPLGNVAGTLTVTVQVSGANPVPQTTVPFQPIGNTGYRFTYTPSVQGTDSIAVKYGGTSISGSPYPSVVAGNTGTFTGTSLMLGFYAGDIGKGPFVSGGAFTTQEPIFRAHYRSTSPSGIDAQMASLDATDSALIAALSDSRAFFTDPSGSCLILNMQKYKDQVDRFVTDSALYTRVKDYCRRRRLILLVIDEPWLNSFCDSIPPSAVREMARHLKLRFPDSITVARIEPEYVHNGWDNSGLLPFNYFDKIDYMFVTYNGRHRRNNGVLGLTPAQAYRSGIDTNKQWGYGSILSNNWVNLGDGRCWDYLGNDASNGFVHGDNAATGVRGVGEPCGSTAETKFVMSPFELDETHRAAMGLSDIADIPMFVNYAWGPNLAGHTTLQNQPFTDLQQRADFIQEAWLPGLVMMNGRTVNNGWRTPK